MLKIIQQRKIWFAFSLALFLASVIAISIWGIRLGIDFTGGTLMEFDFKDKTLNSQEIKDSLKDLNLGEISVQFSGEKDVLMRFKDVDEDTHQKILQSLEKKISEKSTAADNGNSGSNSGSDPAVSGNKAEIPVSNTGKVQEKINPALVETKDVSLTTGNDVPSNSANTSVVTTTDGSATISAEGSQGVTLQPASASNGTSKGIEEKRFDSIGPVIGGELKTSATLAIIIALIAMVFYIGWAFRKVSYPVSSIKYGITATIALFHDVIITIGVFSFLGHFYGVEVGLPFVAAILAILGYSVHDTIVVFDRTRENLLRSGISNFEEIVNGSVNQTITRSVSTSYSVFLVLLCMYLFGGESISYFVLALLVGIFFGTYSSIFIASPLLAEWYNWDLKRK